VSLATLRCDVLVLGSNLGGLVAATYLARLGLRVILIEEEAQAKRPALLREPFLISGLGPGGTLRRVLRELALPLREQALIEVDPIALQVVVPGSRIDVYPAEADLAQELAAHRLLPVEEAASWLGSSESVATRVRQELWDAASAPRSWLPWRNRERDESRDALAVPEPLRGLVACLMEALHPQPPSPTSSAAQLGIAAARDGMHRMPPGTGFLDLFRKRLRSLYGEMHTTDAFSLGEAGAEVEIGLPRGSFKARALVIAAPLEPLRRMLQESGGAPGWWREVAEPLRCPPRLFRLESDGIPVGMCQRVVVAGESEGALHRFALVPDPSGGKSDWLVAGGPGAKSLSSSNPFGTLAPFLRDGLVPIEIGGEPRWDLCGPEIRLLHAPRAGWRRTRIPVVRVGPERSALLGLEGEVLQARSAAIRLGAQLGARKTL
jgi:hypothetical protein